jgi:hypothetical protein
MPTLVPLIPVFPTVPVVITIVPMPMAFTVTIRMAVSHDRLSFNIDRLRALVDDPGRAVDCRWRIIGTANCD